MRFWLDGTPYLAFEPAPIPRALELSAETISLVAQAHQALGELNGIGRVLPNPHILVRPYLRREAVASSALEGTHSSLSDVFAAEARIDEDPAAGSRDLREVLNYVTALEAGLARLSELPPCLRLIKEMHNILLFKVRGRDKTPGEFRGEQNWIDGVDPAAARFVPPPHDLLDPALDDFERYYHEDSDVPILARCALLHYQFETIHPFLDGNGRLGRLLIIFYLVERGALHEPLLYLSSHLDRNRDAYIDSLQAVREEGDYERWIRFFLHAVEVQAREAIQAAEALLNLSRDFGERLSAARVRGRAREAAGNLIASPYVTAPGLARDLNLTKQGAQYIIGQLRDVGILHAADAPGKTALYVAHEVIAALEEAPVERGVVSQRRPLEAGITRST
jgi:Fic family protein